MSYSPAPSPFQNPNPNHPNQNPNSPNPNPNAFPNPLPYPQSDVIFQPPPPSSAAVDPNTQISFTGPLSIAGQSYAQTAQGQEAYYSYLAAYAANQVNQQLYAASSSTYGAVQPGGSGNITVELEKKKLKVLQGGAPVDSIRTCELCNVVCNSDKAFAFHLAGEKHKQKVFGRPNIPLHVKALHFTKKVAGAKKVGAAVGINFVQSTFCDVCKINCNCQEAFNAHKVGRKHLNNLQKLQESINPNLVKTNQSTSEAKAPTKVDLEVKKMKVLNQGAAASAVKVCTYCNVVCNSQEVYNSHIVGKRHIANVNKLQQQSAPAV